VPEFKGAARALWQNSMLAAAPGDQGQGADGGGTQGLLPDRASGDDPRLVSSASCAQIRQLGGSQGRPPAEGDRRPYARARAGARQSRMGLHEDSRRAARPQIEIGRTTVADMLRQVGIEPAPERHRKRTWGQFLQSHWETLYACDFFSVEVLGRVRGGPL
jgi:hypothetical protein